MNKAQRAAIRVLIIDDHKDAADLLNDVLQFYGYSTVVAYSGHDALTLFERVRPEVAILDLGMPSMTGFQLVRNLKATPVHVNTLFVALTGWDTRDVRESALQAGFDFHFVKPADPAAISALIEEEVFRRSVDGAPS